LRARDLQTKHDADITRLEGLITTLEEEIAFGQALQDRMILTSEHRIDVLEETIDSTVTQILAIQAELQTHGAAIVSIGNHLDELNARTQDLETSDAQQLYAIHYNRGLIDLLQAELDAEIDLRKSYDTELAGYIDELYDMSMPIFDSGWTWINKGTNRTIYQLEDKNVFVYMMGSDADSNFTQEAYGPNFYEFAFYGTLYQGAEWYITDNNELKIRRYSDDFDYYFVRVLVWQLPTP